MNRIIKILVFVLSSLLIGQENIVGTPLSFDIEINSIISEIINERVDNNQQLIEDESRPSNTPFRYGKINEVDFNFFDKALKIINNKNEIWLLKIKSRDAYAISLEYNNFKINDLGKFYVYSSDHEIVYGAYSGLNNNSENIFSTPLVGGEEIILEYNGKY